MALGVADAIESSLGEHLPAGSISRDTAAYRVDGITPELVVSPASTTQVAAVVRCASENQAAIIPWGAGRHMGLGAPPERYVVGLDARKLNKIVEHEPADLTLTAEAGVLVSDLQEHLIQHNQWLPLDPPKAGTLGGLLAANASGPSRMRYGTARDHVIGMELVTANGEILKFGGRVVKNVAGYDMAKLQIGALGSLGIITRAAFKVLPLANSSKTSRISGSLDVLMSTSLRLGASGLAINGLELRKDTGYCHLDLIFAGGAGAVVRSQTEVGDLATAAGLSFGEACQLPEPAQDVAVRASVLASNAITICRALVALGASISAYPTAGIVRGHWPASHLPSIDDLERLRSECLGAGSGALVLESGSPELKQSFDVWGPVGSDFDLMRGLKEQFDPNRVLSPGRLLGNL